MGNPETRTSQKKSCALSHSLSLSDNCKLEEDESGGHGLRRPIVSSIRWRDEGRARELQDRVASGLAFAFW